MSGNGQCSLIHRHKICTERLCFKQAEYYQYTAIDKCMRLVFRELYDEHSTYSSKNFLLKLVEVFPFSIRDVQTDNGTEWTNAILVKEPNDKTMFEAALAEMEIRYHRNGYRHQGTMARLRNSTGWMK